VTLDLAASEGPGSWVLTPGPCFLHPASGLDLASFPMAPPPSLASKAGLIGPASFAMPPASVALLMPPPHPPLLSNSSWIVVHAYFQLFIHSVIFMDCVGTLFILVT